PLSIPISPSSIPTSLSTPEHRDYFYPIINGRMRHCYWRGIAPYCEGACYGDYEEDPHFGHPCRPVLWWMAPGTKALCCE
ncbi:hypothetical protein PENTCL1PPCAC_12317, partial [Pristionchus entomophagus]